MVQAQANLVAVAEGLYLLRAKDSSSSQQEETAHFADQPVICQQYLVLHRSIAHYLQKRHALQ